MATLTKKFDEDLISTRKSLEETRAMVDKEIAGENSALFHFFSRKNSDYQLRRAASFTMQKCC